MDFSTSGGKQHLQIGALTGADALLFLLPRSLKLKVVALKLLRHHKLTTSDSLWLHWLNQWSIPIEGDLQDEPFDLEPGGYTFSLPGEPLVYEILNLRGDVRPFQRQHAPE